MFQRLATHELQDRWSFLSISVQNLESELLNADKNS